MTQEPIVESAGRFIDMASYLNNRLVEGTCGLNNDERMEIYRRFDWGEKQYGTAFKSRDMIKEMKEEIHDSLIYLFLLSMKGEHDYQENYSIIEYHLIQALKALRGMKDEHRKG